MGKKEFATKTVKCCECESEITFKTMKLSYDCYDIAKKGWVCAACRAKAKAIAAGEIPAEEEAPAAEATEEATGEATEEATEEKAEEETSADK